MIASALAGASVTSSEATASSGTSWANAGAPPLARIVAVRSATVVFLTQASPLIHFRRGGDAKCIDMRSEEHTSELQSLMRISYAVFCLKKKQKKNKPQTNQYKS